jgi:endonuclease VIII
VPVPEGDTIFRAATTLRRWLAGREITGAQVRVSRVPVRRLIGATVTEVETRGKHLLMRLSSGDVLHTHMGMTGSWHVYPAGERWFRPAVQARLVLEAGDRVAVCFNAPVVELLSGRDEVLHPSLSRLGPDVLGESLDLEDVRRRARMRTEAGAIRLAGELLLDQQVASGIGNIYRCESLYLCGVNPWMPIAVLGDAQIDTLLLTAARLMKSSVGVAAPAAGADPARRGPDAQRRQPWVYGRSGKPCRRCGTVIRSQRLGRDARTAYWCPACQPGPPIEHRDVVAAHQPPPDGVEDESAGRL